MITYSSGAPSTVADQPEVPFGAFFDADPEAAHRQVLALRTKLAKYFAWHHCYCPDELVSETLFRALSRISRGCEVPNLDRFCYGIAVNVLREEWKKRPELELDNDWAGADSAAYGRLNRSEQARLLEECLQTVGLEDRAALKEYFCGDRGDFAVRLGISPTALRIRVHRILEKIRAQVGGKGFGD